MIRKISRNPLFQYGCVKKVNTIGNSHSSGFIIDNKNIGIKLHACIMSGFIVTMFLYRSSSAAAKPAFPVANASKSLIYLTSKAKLLCSGFPRREASVRTVTECPLN